MVFSLYVHTKPVQTVQTIQTIQIYRLASSEERKREKRVRWEESKGKPYKEMEVKKEREQTGILGCFGGE